MRHRTMKCPKCKQVDLTSQVINEIEVDQCPTCRGIWFDEQELPRMLTHASQDIKPLTKGKERTDLDKVTGQCPVDDSDLMRVFSQMDRSVVVDRCPKCLGIWLDGGELKRLAK